MLVSLALYFLSWPVFKHPFHIVSPSPWPLLTALAMWLFLGGLVFALSAKTFVLFFLGSFILLLSCSCWAFDIIVESSYLGYHTLRVQSGIRLAIFLFICSEVFFFFAFFWAFFHSSLSPTVELGCQWPPAGVFPLSASGIPLVNTLVLLTSCATVTWSHLCLLSSEYVSSFFALSYTLLLSVLFLCLQAFEFYSSSFCISDSVFGSCFFLLTGFHGLHVFIGSLLLFLSWVRLFMKQLRATRHLGFLTSVWYWHFVDVVWLLLFLWQYVWGS